MDDRSRGIGEEGPSTSRTWPAPKPLPATQAQRHEITLTAGEDIPQPGQRIKDLAARRREFKDHLAERQSLLIPAHDPHREPFGPAFPAWPSANRDAILLPPKPQIQPSAEVLWQTSIDGAKLSGVLRLTWLSDRLAHVLQHSQTDEPTGTWTGLACPDHELALGADVEPARLQTLFGYGDVADLIWETPADLAAEHGHLLLAAIRGDGVADGGAGLARQLRQQARHERPGPAPRLHPAEPGAGPGHQLTEYPRPAARVYAGASGHHKIITSRHKPG